MKIRKILAFLTAVILTCSASSCTLRGKGSSSEEADSKKSDSDDERDKDDDDNDTDDDISGRYQEDFNPIKDSDSLDKVRKDVRTLLDDLKTESDEDDIQDDIDALLADFDEVYEKYTELMIPYYLDIENEALEATFDGQISLDFGNVIEVSIGQFYGIEINDFAVTVAKTTLTRISALPASLLLLHSAEDIIMIITRIFFQILS